MGEESIASKQSLKEKINQFWNWFIKHKQQAELKLGEFYILGIDKEQIHFRRWG